MHASPHITKLILLLVATMSAWAQAPASQSGDAAISGRVTVGKEPLPNLTVSAQRLESNSSSSFSSSGQAVKATTDQDGNYRLTGLAQGRYRVMALSTVFVMPEETPATAGKIVTVNNHEQLENVDLSLTRGAIITGKVLDENGRPLIGERVTLVSIDEQGRKRPLSMLDSTMYEIDDRGVYRVFGLPAGRYLISAGQATDGSGIRIGASGPTYQRTFHPNVTDEAKAIIIELSEGREATDIDIAIGRPVKTYEASGRIINGETGQPMPYVRFGYGGLREGTTTLASSGASGTPTNEKGEFRIEGLPNGRYAAFLYNETDLSNATVAEYYSDPVSFEINNSNVFGLEIKVQRANTISGVIVSEDGNNQTLLRQARQLVVYASPMDVASSRPSGSAQSRIQSDGSFRLTGLSPGKIRLTLSGLPGLQLVRTERAGRQLSNSTIDVAPSEQITGVRLVVSYGAGVIRGVVRVVGGTLPPGTRMLVSYRRLNATGANGATVQVDARGQFLAENLSPGSYTLTLMALIPGSNTTPPMAEQMVTVTNGSEMPVTMTLDLSSQ